jgi:hypothetical protein
MSGNSLPDRRDRLIARNGEDRPFSGEMGISPDSYQLIYDHHMKVDPGR